MGKIYDDVFRTLCEKNPRLLIPIINEVFGTHYKMTEKLELLSGDHHFLMEDGAEPEERITDSCIRIGNKMYHIECQSWPDGTMILRMVEYDFVIALDHAEKSADGVYEMNFPAPAVLYLRHNAATPDKLQMNIHFPEGESVTYRVPIIKVQNYTEQDIVERKLYFLIPYYIMRYENMAEQDIPEDLVEEYRTLYHGMVEADEKGLIDEYDMSNIIELTKILAGYLFQEGDKARKGVDDVMGGQVLETYADKKLRQGLEQGLERGVELMGQLSIKLAEDGRIQEISHAVEDEAIFQKLLLEYNITTEKK